MTIWIFGDSFADQYTPANTWMQQVADAVNHDPMFFGKGGTSLDYTYEKFNEVRDQINDNDIVILALTDLSRRWFFRDEANETIWETMKKGGKIGTAVTQYLKYLTNDHVYILYLTNFLYNLQHLTRQHNTHTIVLPCFDFVCEETEKIKSNFPEIHFANKSLVRISVDELEDGMVERLGMLRHGLDLRYSHLIKSNHIVLANKIINNIKNNESLNLKEGFVKKLLNPSVLTDLEFAKTEMFNAQNLDFYDSTCELLRRS